VKHGSRLHSLIDAGDKPPFNDAAIFHPVVAVLDGTSMSGLESKLLAIRNISNNWRHKIQGTSQTFQSLVHIDARALR
jgi:hypothetical protein